MVPKAVVQLCIVHRVRHSLNYVPCKRRKEVAADLRRVYQSATVEEAELRLGELEAPPRATCACAEGAHSTRGRSTPL